MPYTRALVIINPVSGRHDPAETQQMLEDRLAAEGLAYEVRATRAAGDALRWAQAAADEGFDLVIASGGDGTIMEAMSGLIKAGATIPLAQIPVGTANLLARALGISSDPAEAIEVIFSGKQVRLDVGYLPDEDRYFALVAGAGYDAQLIGDASRELKNRLGFAAYVLTGIKNLFKLRRSRVELEIDGRRRRFRAHTVMVANIGTLGAGALALGPNIHPHDGKLDLIVISSASLAGALRILWQLLTGRFEGNANLRYFSASRVRITARPPLPTQLDGEELGTTPLAAEAVPDGALLLVPQTYHAHA
ncbi:diacylglycerol/lipid kinase family protein [Kallotenue papyrolyticum]|uniref:diacylglycerol/lipid kinase family protein n=1 Tax=Kallotenue papyrolyticum TaxID=1325125 RepID=UPI000478650B|nr:diacylglycerol kinase family protein [Kallotenue papyrolyticum]